MGGGGGWVSIRMKIIVSFWNVMKLKKERPFFLTGNVPISFTLHGFFVILFRYFGNRIESVLSS